MTVEGWTAQDRKDYEGFVSKVDMVSPETAGNSYAQVLTHIDYELSGLIVDYDDRRLPIEEHLKNKVTDGPRTYAQYSSQTNC